MNYYRYAFNNPLAYIDPKGLGPHCGSGWLSFFVPDSPAGYDFGNCCQKHDNCYDRKSDDGKADARCSVTKEQCDNEFHNCMKNQCKRYPFRADDMNTEQNMCERIANDYYRGVQGYIGNKAFEDAGMKSKCHNPNKLW